MGNKCCAAAGECRTNRVEPAQAAASVVLKKSATMKRGVVIASAEDESGQHNEFKDD